MFCVCLSRGKRDLQSGLKYGVWNQTGKIKSLADYLKICNSGQSNYLFISQFHNVMIILKEYRIVPES